MRAFLSKVMLLLLVKGGACFLTVHPCAIHKTKQRECAARRRTRHASSSYHHHDYSTTTEEELLFARMETDQQQASTVNEEWPFLQVIITLNAVLLWMLLAHASPVIETKTTRPLQSGQETVIQRKQPSTYEEDEVIMLMYSSAGFYFY